MWSRAQLKDKAKYALKMNYWKIVLVTFLVSIVIGGASSTGSSASSGASSGLSAGSLGFIESEDGPEDYYFEDDEYYYDEDNGVYEIEDLEQFDGDDIYSEDFLGGFAVFGMFFLGMFIFILIIVLAISLVYAAFIANPFTVGAKRFYLKSLKEPGKVKELGFAFDNSYKNVATIMFFKTLYTFLWSLLFVIPGIVKAYEYMMIPYLLAENPNLTKEEAFAISKQMMDGNKWKTFVLELSFFGWDILSSCTLGIVGFLYVEPYKRLTEAALYEELSLIHGRPGVVQPNVDTQYQQENPYAQAPNDFGPNEI